MNDIEKKNQQLLRDLQACRSKNERMNRKIERLNKKIEELKTSMLKEKMGHRFRFLQLDEKKNN